jgi:hypothetical protein
MKMNENQNTGNQPIAGTKYYCPMKCEGEKTYDQPGLCPVCNMHLVPVGQGHQHH